MSAQLIKIIEERNTVEVKTLTDDLVMGKAKDYAEYKYYCGIIRGLTKANSLTQELAQQMRQDDDDE